MICTSPDRRKAAGGNSIARNAHRMRVGRAAANGGGGETSGRESALEALCAALRAILEGGPGPHRIKGQKGRKGLKGHSPWRRSVRRYCPCALQDDFRQPESIRSASAAISDDSKMLPQSAGRFPTSRKCPCTLQGDFRRLENVPARCRTISDSPKMLLHAAGRFPTARKCPCTLQEDFRTARNAKFHSNTKKT